MKKIAITMIILAGAWLVPQAVLANPPGVKIQMELPMQRRISAIAKHDGRVTLAGGGAYASYHMQYNGTADEELRRACEAMPREQRFTCVECLAFEQFKAWRDENAEALAAIYKPGYSRTKAVADLENLWSKARKQGVVPLSPYMGIRLLDKSLWDDRVILVSVGIKPDKKTGGYIQLLQAIKDTKTGQYQLVDDITDSIDYPHRLIGGGIKSRLDSPPRDARIIRLSIDPDSPPRQRTVTATKLKDRSQIEEDDLILYVRDEPFPADAPPFLEIDPAALDKAGQQLQNALKYVVLWNAEKENTTQELEKMMALFDPVEQSSIRHNMEQNLKMNGKLSDPLGFTFYAARDYPQMRIASRVFTNNGVVWFAWAPKPGAKGPKDVFISTFIQQLAPDGTYVLVSYPVFVQGADHNAVRLLYGNSTYKHNGVVWPLTRLQRETQLGKPGR